MVASGWEHCEAKGGAVLGSVHYATPVFGYAVVPLNCFRVMIV